MENQKRFEIEAKPRRRLAQRLIRWFPSLMVLVLVGAVFLMADMIRTEGEAVQKRNAGELRTTREKTNVVAMEMVPAAMEERISLPGTVRPWVSLRVLVEVRGRIVEKRVAEGARVHKGEVLARIDPRDYENALASARASYEVAAASLGRLQALFDDQLATRSQLDDAVARVKTTRATMDNARLDLDRCVILSPMDGVVDRVLVENGQFMNSGDPLADMLQMDRVKVAVGIPESDVDAVRRLERFDVTIDALNGKRFKGRRHYLYKTADSLARLYSLEIAVDNPGGEILPDMFARVEIVKHRVDQGLAVPLYSIVEKSSAPAVYVVENDVAVLRPVSTGIQDGWRIQIAGGLSAGEKVVVVGQRLIAHGETVHVTRTVRNMEELDQ